MGSDTLPKGFVGTPWGAPYAEFSDKHGLRAVRAISTRAVLEKGVFACMEDLLIAEPRAVRVTVFLPYGDFLGDGTVMPGVAYTMGEASRERLVADLPGYTKE